MYLINQEEINVRKLKYNGYIVQKRPAISVYKGIEGDNWYLNYCTEDPYFEEFFNANIDKAWENPDYVDCCTDETYVKKYVEESRKNGIDFRILLCATARSFPSIEKIALGRTGEILGYDYAYSGGSYYSCILNDIISKRIEEFKQIRINKNGLFDSYEEAEEFGRYRNNLISANSGYDFERGDYIIYEISEIYI